MAGEVRGFRFSLRALLIFIAVIGGFVGLLLAAITKAREAAYESSCCGWIGQLSLAFERYEDVTGRLPPAYTVDLYGQPMHSWRVLLLPYLEDDEATEIFKRYRMDEPWNSPHNIDVAKWIPREYVCPSEQSNGNNFTNYLAVVGAGTLWPDGVHSRKPSTDETSVLLVELPVSKIVWTDPRDYKVNSGSSPLVANSGTFSSGHPNGPHIALKPWHVISLGNSAIEDTIRQISMDPEALQAFVKHAP